MLRDCQLSDDTAVVAAEALLSNTAITSLNMRGNQIGDKGVRALCNMLLKNPNISTLDISHNAIGDEGARCVLNAVDKATKSGEELGILRIFFHFISYS